MLRHSLVQTIPPTVEPVSLDEMKDHLVVEHDDHNRLIQSYITAARVFVENFTHRQLVAATWEYRLDGFPSEITLPKAPYLKVSSLMYYNTSSTWTTLTKDTDYDVDIRIEPASIIPAYGAYWTTPLDFRNVVKTTYISGYVVPVTVSASTDKLTLSGYTTTDGDTIQLSVSGGERAKLPGGLSENTMYYVISTSGSTCELSLTSGGSKIDITSTGTGQIFIGRVPETIKLAMKMLVAHFYENREQTAGTQVPKEIAMSAQDLLAHDCFMWEQRG